MKLDIKNVGLIKQALINVEKISIIAAENNTGKSTIGKILYDIYYIGNNYELFYNKKTLNEIENIFKSYEKSLFSKMDNEQLEAFEHGVGKKIILDNFKQSVLTNIEKYFLEDQSFNENILTDFKTEYVNKENYILSVDDINSIDDLLEQISNTVKKIKNKPQLYNDFVIEYFSSNYPNGVKNFYSMNADSVIELSNEKETFEAVFSNNEFKSCNSNLSNMKKHVVYIESPLILDKQSISDGLSNLYSKELDLQLKKVSDFESSDSDKEIIFDIINKINDIISGQLFFNTNKGEYIFKKNNHDIPMNRLASGYKAFGIISRLLENNYLSRNSILILDEPEAYLHPNWQIKYIEILCLLATKLDVKILLNSHSPYIVESLSVFSKLFKINDDVNFYSLSVENDGNTTGLKNDELSSLYFKLMEPYQYLEDIKTNFSKQVDANE